MMTDSHFIPLESYCRYQPEVMEQRAASFREHMQHRRSIRHFSTESFPRAIIADCLLSAGTAPSGANKQPWHFVVVSNASLKRQIRQAAEQAETEFYQGRAGDEWLAALSCLGTDYHKPFLEEAPYLIVIFGQRWGVLKDGTRDKHYYVHHSVGIATGMLITAIHQTGLAALPYTPSRMAFLRELLGCKENEFPFLILAVGYPAERVLVPKLEKKSLNEIATFL